MSKFCYEEGEIRFADCQCEFCIYYNNGERSKECPIELLDKIKSNEIRCPNGLLESAHDIFLGEDSCI